MLIDLFDCSMLWPLIVLWAGYLARLAECIVEIVVASAICPLLDYLNIRFCVMANPFYKGFEKEYGIDFIDSQM